MRIMNKEEQLLRKRLMELAGLCYQRDVPVYTDFLNLYEQTIFFTMASSLPDLKTELAGGYELAERKIVCFLPSYTETAYHIPLKYLKVVPAHQKFAQELTHRDYLGALMNLGIERCKIGDILIDGQQCYIICIETMADYLANELVFVNHTKVQCEIADTCDMVFQPRFESISGSVASERLDNIIALAYQLSRSKAVSYIEAEKVFINGRLSVTSHEQLQERDVVSVRGMGKFVYRGLKNQTKKGRLFVTLEKYC